MAIAASQKRSTKPNRVLTVESNEEEMASNLTYTATSQGGALRRIRTPSPHDVLSGRGGNVNAHPGNQTFREWVKVRREDYSLAFSKEEKALICREVIALVEKRGGRFLVKESPSSQFWIELDDERVMAKTSQALREGAPQIRAEHKDEIAEKRLRAKKGTKRRNAEQGHSTKVVPSVIPSKRARFEQEDLVVPSVETSNNAMELTDDVLMPAPEAVPSIPLPHRLSSGWSRPTEGLKRQNSLALSEFGDMDVEFVNPFADESELLGRKDGVANVSIGSVEGLSLVPRPGSLWRESSTASNVSDMGGLGALFRSSDSAKSNTSIGSLPSMGSFLRDTSMSSSIVGAPSTLSWANNRDSINNLSNRYDADFDDALSVATETTLDLPVWEWFNQNELASSSQQIPVSF
jgi:hypothetical protein